MTRPSHRLHTGGRRSVGLERGGGIDSAVAARRQIGRERRRGSEQDPHPEEGQRLRRLATAHGARELDGPHTDHRASGRRRAFRVRRCPGRGSRALCRYQVVEHCDQAAAAEDIAARQQGASDRSLDPQHLEVAVGDRPR